MTTVAEFQRDFPHAFSVWAAKTTLTVNGEGVAAHKPNWDDEPSWVDFVGIFSNGVMYRYENKPERLDDVRGGSFGWEPELGRWEYLGTMPSFLTEYNGLLFERPQAQEVCGCCDGSGKIVLLQTNRPNEEFDCPECPI